MTKSLTAKEKAERRAAREARAKPPAPVTPEATAHEPVEETVDQGMEDGGPEAALPAPDPRASEIPATKAELDVDLAPDAYRLEEKAEPQEEAPAEPVAAEAETAELLPKEWIVLRQAASYGPVVIDGGKQRCKKGTLYYVPNAEERAEILGTGRFRAATKEDLLRSRQPSAGPGGPITRDLLPPGALKGGLANR